MTNFQNKFFISSVAEALIIKKTFKLYTLEKEYAKAKIENEPVNKNVCSKVSGCVNYKFRNPLNPDEKKKGFFDRLLDEDSTENFFLKSILGFIGGVLLTYICFIFLVFSLNFTLKRATYICMGLGVLLTLGLAFSVKIRCTVFLCIPQLFSKRGRQALLAYAFILALSGPAKNTLHNVEVMSESLACGQEQLNQAENDLLRCLQKPNAAAKKAIEKLLEGINPAVKDFQTFILQFYRICFNILETVFQAQKWLYSTSLLCNKIIGVPAQHCLKLISESVDNCQSIRLLEFWKEICQIEEYEKSEICFTEAKAVCLGSDLPRTLPVSKLQKQLNNFKHRAMNIFYVKLEAHQIYSQLNRSNTYHEEYQGMATEIRQKTDQFLQYFDFMSVIFGIFIMVLFVKVIIYRHKFLTEDHYDNRFITNDFEDIDNARAEFQMETVLPLEPREKLKYIKVTSVRLVPCEKLQLLSSFVFLIFATFKIIIHILIDSSLYWILSFVRRDEKLLYISSIKEVEPSITARVVGDGLVAALLRNVTKAVKQQSTTMKIDPTPCLPDPVPPDWNRYYQILALVLICWLLAVCEPYGLRLRHTVMVKYHPDRARERAIWLYNRIISNRRSFVKVARREIRKKYKDIPQDSFYRFQFLRKKIYLKCLLCKVRVDGQDNYVKCQTKNCLGIFCCVCYKSLKLCSICKDPAEYGDLSDLSEEKDSSEDEDACKCNKKVVKPVKINKAKKPPPIKSDLPPLNLRNVFAIQKKESDYSKHLLQPTLLMGVIKYCRKKILALRNIIHLSDVESTDWDTSLCIEDTSAENKPIPLEECSNNYTNIEEINNETEESEVMKLSPIQKYSRLENDDKISKIKEEKTQNVAHKNLIGNKATPTSFFTNEENVLQHDQKKKVYPDFLFKPIEKHTTKKCKKNEEGEEDKKGPTNEKETQTFLALYSSLCPKCPQMGNRCLDRPGQVQLKNASVLCESSSGGFYWDSSQGKEKIGTDDSASDQGAISKSNLQSRGRVRFRDNHSTDFTQDTLISSVENNRQIYGQSNRQREPRKETVKRTAEKINVKSANYSQFYLVETDSSNEEFLSTKPTRKAKLVRLSQRNTPENMSSDESQNSDIEERGYLPNATVFISDEEYENLSKKLSEQKVEENESLLPDQFQKKSSQISWAPDLLSDLPSSKYQGSETSTD